ncbi:MAG: tetratricopeptide repeat protein [Candidatus Cloacimonetes bacterium]|nr:tetratricopeptide repeat protein [Candidatus Cloacimonadota bacterium]
MSKKIKKGKKIVLGFVIAITIMTTIAALTHIPIRTTNDFTQRGNEFFKKGDFEAAITDFDHAIKIDPLNAVAHFLRGNTYHEKGEYDKAIEDYCEAIKLELTYANIYNYRGLAYIENGDYEKAIADFSQAIKANPNRVYSSTEKDKKKGASDKAILDSHFATRKDINNTSAYFNRANAYSKKGDYDKAIAEYTQVIKINPNYFAAYINRGLAFDKKGDYDKAVADFILALRIDPNNQTAKASLEMAKIGRGY